MSDNYNYGPRMSFEKLDDFQSANTPFIASTYLGDSQSSFLSTNTENSSMSSTTSATTTLGSHWKKRNTVSGASASVSAGPSSFDLSSIDSVASSNFSDSTIQQTNGSLKSFSGSSSTTETDRSQKLKVARLLFEDKDTRECLSLHSRGLGEVEDMVNGQIDACLDRHVELQMEFHEQKKELKRMRTLWQNYKAALKDVVETVRDELDIKSNQLLDTVSLMLHEFGAKERIEKFVRKYEGVYETSMNTMETIEDNTRRVENIQKLIMEHHVDNGRLTVFEQEDIRIETVYNQLVAMIQTLPLSHQELNDMKQFIEKTDEHFEYSKIYKCDLICRRLFATMGTWNSMNSTKSDDWRSVCNLNGGVYSSSFALSDFTANDLLSDSNLADLDGELRAARVRRAVEGPNGVIEMNPWSSLVTGYSSSGEKLVASNSLGEPRTLSSYEYESSDVSHSTCSSLSRLSMPFYEKPSVSTLENSDLSMKTALSVGSPVIARSPRENHNDKEDTTVGTRTPSEDLSLETIEEVLHTAKAISETQTANLFDALKNSANKCGVEMADLFTAVSSGSESVSDTQSTSSSQHSYAH